MERSKADSFSAFLEARQRSKLRSATGSGTPLALLNALADAEQKQMPVKDLMTASGMAITDFADALKSLQASGHQRMNVVGPNVLIAAVDSLRDKMKDSGGGGGGY